MKDGDSEKSQVGMKNLPVVWKVLLSQELTATIEKYAKKRSIPEAEVFREALQAYFKGV